MDDHIIPECYIDTILIETLVRPGKKTYNHQKGCGAVAKEMKEKFNDNFAVGIIDKDKELVNYVLEFKPVVIKYDVELYKHPHKNHYMIVHPPIEKWIIEQAAQTNLKLPDYNLPDDFKLLRKITKVANKKDERFKALFRDLKKSAIGMKLLANWVEYLKIHPYSADKSQLESFN